jgi:hypothetical protein
MTETSGGQADQLMSEREDLGLAAICLAVIVLSIGGLVAALTTGLLGTLDGLLLIMVCLMMVAIFAPPLLALAKELMASGGKKPAKDSGEGK